MKWLQNCIWKDTVILNCVKMWPTTTSGNGRREVCEERERHLGVVSSTTDDSLTFPCCARFVLIRSQRAVPWICNCRVIPWLRQEVGVDKSPRYSQVQYAQFANCKDTTTSLPCIFGHCNCSTTVRNFQRSLNWKTWFANCSQVRERLVKWPFYIFVVLNSAA